MTGSAEDPGEMTVAIDPTRQAMRHALLRELMNRAMTTMERADWQRDRARPPSESEGPADNESHVGPDDRKGGSAAD